MGKDLKGQGKNQKLRDVIRDSSESLADVISEGDPAFDAGRDLPRSGEQDWAEKSAAGLRKRDAIVIDELLMSVPRNQGYYLKLYKELMPGQWEFKEKIESYDTWTDLELELVNRVKAFTVKSPKKWGSGTYRLVVWRADGIREKDKWAPLDFPIDAGDGDAGAINEGKIDGAETLNSQMQTLQGILSAVQQLLPKPQDAGVVQDQLATAFASGMNARGNDASSTTAMMTAMVTAMMGMFKDLMVAGRPSTNGAAEPVRLEDSMTKIVAMLKDFGVIGNQGQGIPPKSVLEQLAELKAFGIDPLHKDDPLDQITKMKQIVTTLADVMGSGGKGQPERPGIVEKLIDALAPHLPRMIGDLKSVTENAVKAQEMQGRVSRPATRGLPPVRESASPIYPPPTSPEYPPEELKGGDQARASFGSEDFVGRGEKPPTPQADKKVDGGEGIPVTLNEEAEEIPLPDGPVINLPDGPIVTPPLEKIKEPVNMEPLMQQLYMLIKEEKTDAFSVIYQTVLPIPGAAEMIQSVLKDQVSIDEFKIALGMYGGRAYQHKDFIPKRNRFVDGFVKWLKENVEPIFEAVCNKCQSGFAYEGLEHFQSDTVKRCSVPQADARGQLTGVICDGTIVQYVETIH
jgi:hypothetical protein